MPIRSDAAASPNHPHRWVRAHLGNNQELGVGSTGGSEPVGAPSSKLGNRSCTSTSEHESPGYPDSAEASIQVHLALLSSALDPGLTWGLHPVPVPVCCPESSILPQFPCPRTGGSIQPRSPCPGPARPTPRRAPRCPLPRLRTAKGPVESPVGSGAAESPGAGPQSGPSPPGPRLQRGRRHRDPPSGSATAAPGSPSGTPGTNQPTRNSPEIPFKK